LGERPNNTYGFWITFGILNNIIATRDRAFVSKIAMACRDHKAAYEWLRITDGVIVYAERRSDFPAINHPPEKIRKYLSNYVDDIDMANFELALALRVVMARVVPLRPRLKWTPSIGQVDRENRLIWEGVEGEGRSSSPPPRFDLAAWTSVIKR
jgi:hypothetical protein